MRERKKIKRWDEGNVSVGGRGQEFSFMKLRLSEFHWFSQVEAELNGTLVCQGKEPNSVSSANTSFASHVFLGKTEQFFLPLSLHISSFNPK